MTDNEIIKALELIKSDPNCDMVYGRYISTMTLDDTLNLINRQKAEIARLKATVDSFTDIGKLYSEIKAEAIKEFAERLKKELSLCKKECRKFLDNDGAFAIDKARKKVDILVKEMVGEDNNSLLVDKQN